MGNPDLTVDVIIKCDNEDIVLVKKNKPYGGYWELLGGFAEYGEEVESTALREAEEGDMIKNKYRRFSECLFPSRQGPPWAYCFNML